jgi:hypothetical protein
MIKPDPLMSASYGASDLTAMNNRVVWMEYLYHLDGRDMKDHPKHGLFNGLAHTYRLLTPNDD